MTPASRWWCSGDEELVALVEQQGVGGVEVLRSGLVVVGRVGVAASDEPEDLLVVDDGEHGAVAEPVDESSGGGGGGDAGGEHLVVGDAVAVEVGDEAGPAVGGVAGADVGVVGEVGAEPFGEVGLGPRAAVAGLVELAASSLMAARRSGVWGLSRQASARSSCAFRSAAEISGGVITRRSMASNVKARFGSTSSIWLSSVVAPAA